MPDTAAALPDLAALETARQLLADVVAATPANCYASDAKPDKVPAARKLFDAPPAVRRAAAIEVQEMIGNGPKESNSLLGMIRQLGTGVPNNRDLFLTQVLAALLRSKLPFTQADLDRLLAGSLSDASRPFWFHVPPSGYIRAAEQVASEHGGLPDSTKGLLRKFRERVPDHDATHRKYRQQIDALLGITAHAPVLAGEAWSDGARAFLDSRSDDDRRAWVAFLSHCATASAGTPSGKWLDAARLHVQSVGAAGVRQAILDWLPLVAKPRPTPLTNGWRDPHYHICDPNVDVLKGLAWSATLVPSADVARAVSDLCETALKRLPGVGPRLPKLANAAAYALGQLCDDPASADAALGQLARLRTRVTYKSTLAQIDKALDAVAKRRNLTRDDLDELGIPTFGFVADGTRTETLGDCTVTLRIDGDSVVTTWTSDKGKPVKSPPAAVKRDHAEALKELKAAAKDAEQMLAAQRDRLDRLFVTMKTWPLADFRQRYLAHPLIGPLARRLIWTVDGAPVLFVAGDAAQVVDGRPVAATDASVVTLWHPVGRTVEEVTAWRRRLEGLGVTQPFKQAHREVYILTDAELNTRTYSNRFAAHVVRQHQFHALCGHRGWRNKLRLLVDDTFPPASRDLPAFNLRAEFCVEGAGDDYGTDTNDTGVFLRLTTDQVRFYPLGTPQNAAHASGGGYRAGWQRDPATPLPLVDVPALAFSEIMRDVDLFVGVASVGNDPGWADGGPAGRYREYWQSFSFGDLSATAQTRRDVLGRLLPRLKIAGRCTLADRFLHVRGDLRTYKIHLGSGNILMEPNDQYLCIVPDRSTRAADTTLFLPFEGDTVLAIILSKAFMLADDTKITDPTITRQIGRT